MPHIKLSAIDHVLATENVPPLQFVLRFDGALSAERVEAAYRATLREFVGSSGTLVELDANNLAFDVSRELAEFHVVEGAADAPLTSCVNPVRTVPGGPLASARITRLAGGRGTALGFSLSHAVTDGYGYFLLMTAWAARARGQPSLPPACDRAPLCRPVANSERPDRPPDDGQLPYSGYFLGAENTGPSSLSWHERLVARELLEAKPADRGLSTNDHVSAVLWKEFVDDARHDTSTLACAVDVRRHRPELGPLYFGNAVLLSAVTVNTAELRSAPVDQVGRWIHDAVAAVPGRIDAALQELEELRARYGLGVLRKLRGFQPGRGFLVTNLSRLPLLGLDFGAGAPVEVEVASPTPAGRTCIVLPTSSGELRLKVARP